MPIQALTKMITSSIRGNGPSPEAEQLTSFDLSLYSFTFGFVSSFGSGGT